MQDPLRHASRATSPGGPGEESWGIRRLDFCESCLHIVEDIHEVDVAVVGGVVGGEVFVDIAVGPILGAHVVEVIAGGEFSPVGEDVFDFG